MINRSKYTDCCQPKCHLKGIIGESGKHRRETNTHEKNDNHPVAMPTVRQMSRYGGTCPEENEGRDSIGNHFGIGSIFCQTKSQTRAESRLGKNQHQHMVDEMTNIQKKKPWRK